MRLKRRQYDLCAHCGLCLEACPTFHATGLETRSPRGRVQMLRGLNERELPATPGLCQTTFECLDCRACEVACPSGVKIGHLVEAGRAYLRAERPPRGAGAWLLTFCLRHLIPYSGRLRLTGRLLRFYQRTGLNKLARFLGLTRLLPTPFREMEVILPLVPARTGRESLWPGLAARGPAKGRAALFLGCVMDVFFAGTNAATARVLAVNGFDVIVPAGQGCCGALHLHSGDPAGARDLARRNIDAFLASGADYVVTNAGGCGAALLEYPDVLAEDCDYAAKASVFAKKVVDVFQLLDQTGLKYPTYDDPRRVAYQGSCHLHNVMKAGDAVKRVLAQIPGLTLLPMPEESYCCGSAGIYNLTHPELANQLLKRKMANLPPGVEVVATANPGCWLQLLLGSRKYGPAVTVDHAVNLLDRAYGN